MARFLRGQSGNPGGRPKDSGKAAKLAREHTAHAVFALVRIASDVQAPSRMQFEAAREILRLGFGRVPTAAAPDGSTEGIGRFPGLRSRIETIVAELDQQHSRYRRVLLLELGELERVEGLTVDLANRIRSGAATSEDLEPLEPLEELERPEYRKDG